MTSFDNFFKPSEFATAPLRRAITAAYRTPEPQAVQAIAADARVPADIRVRAKDRALQLAHGLRHRKAASGRAGIVQNLLQEYSLSSQEGVALMCLAEALLRIPDAATRDALIRDKISQGQWRTHLGQSPSLFVNAATWGLLITGKLVSTHSESGLSASVGKLVATGGEPLVRKGVDMAMRMMGEQFVTGENIGEALANSREREAQGFRYSFDMLGEAALTAQDAARYLRDYETAIHAIGKASAGRGIFEGPGISIKLSALHPRYGRAQYDRVMGELYATLVRLCALAKRYDIGLNIDAEEADRLELSLDLLEKLAFEPQLAGWNGLGFVIQAYQKRCPQVIDYVIDLARRSNRRLMIRLVKGAYWDSEIKRAQVDGLDDYPVYTRKPYTDAAYIACARKLLDAPDAIFPQFATHNAHTVASIHELAGPSRYHAGQYEFQCLHGMGEPLYEHVVGGNADASSARPCRIYAPVGSHETLLAYLVRRLLENGANTSFVNRIADETIPLEELVRDPMDVIDEFARADGQIGAPHPAIPLPSQIYGPLRRNSRGIDLSNEAQLHALSAAFNSADTAGVVQDATTQEVELAITRASQHADAWAAVQPAERADMLDRAADMLEQDTARLCAILIREAGKTTANAVAEVREAVDFLRYYGRQVREQFNNDTHRPLGPVVCISPWNFPLAIFMGQVTAALAAGNVVLAKPAEQTPFIAAEAVRTLWKAGVPEAAVQLVPGPGAVVGSQLVADTRVQGVLFTGSTEVARILQRALAGRLTSSGRALPLIAETGGQNAMIVDSSALAEQVVADVVSSAFDSAGQRCSALRVLCVQEDAADRVLDMLLGAMAELRVGSPERLSTDVGPVIDTEAMENIERHIAAMRKKGKRVHQVARAGEGQLSGTFVLPTVIEIQSVSELEREVFGPVIHFVRYPREGLDALIEQINGTGYGLTMGLHTRIDETIARVVGASHVGNIYVNRNMVGAVVGVQPFGGEGLSGTGPKAGGPLYLYRLLSQRPDDVLQKAGLSDRSAAGENAIELPGPTGERNLYSIRPRKAVLCLASNDEDRLRQLAAVMAVGGHAIWPAECTALLRGLPDDQRTRVSLAADWTKPDVAFDCVLVHGDVDELERVQHILAARNGPVICAERIEPGSADIPVERLVIERSISTNTAAAGGNASLMTIA